MKGKTRTLLRKGRRYN